jgi:archaellum biogenesis protein FlaJ (TadC family)
MLVLLSIFSGYIFFEPFWIFYISGADAFNFSLLVAISTLTALTIPMGIYRVKILRSSSKKMSPGFVGSIIGASAGACGCLSMNVAVLSIFGTLGSTFLSFSTAYAIHLRLISIVILAVTYYITVRGITTECKIDLNDKIE